MIRPHTSAPIKLFDEAVQSFNDAPFKREKNRILRGWQMILPILATHGKREEKIEVKSLLYGPQSTEAVPFVLFPSQNPSTSLGFTPLFHLILTHRYKCYKSGILGLGAYCNRGPTVLRRLDLRGRSFQWRVGRRGRQGVEATHRYRFQRTRAPQLLLYRY